MSFRINTNVSALNAFRNLSQTGMEIGKATQRLSTGLRINSGADDPSGLIASEGYRAQIGGIDQALKNNQDAMNFAKTAEGGLDEVSRLLRDARALAVANGNSSLDQAQKQANQTQLNSIVASIDRIASSTQFGTKKLLDGSTSTNAQVVNTANVSSASFGGKFGTVNIGSDGTADVNVTTAAEQATLTGAKTLSAATDTVGAGTFSVNGKVFSTSATTTQNDIVNMLNAASSETGVTASISSGAVKLDSVAYGSDAKVTLVDSNAILQTAAGTATDSGVNAVATVTYNYGTNSATSTFNKGSGLDLKDADGNSISLTTSGNATGSVTGVLALSAQSASFQIGANAGQTASLSIGKFDSATLAINSLDITGTDMSSAMTAIDSAIKNVAQGRANIGSFMRNTLESNVRSLGVAKENLAATESAIREIDVAEEMTNYSKLQILQQSGLSMLAQANSAPQGVLSLLR